MKNLFGLAVLAIGAVFSVSLLELLAEEKKKRIAETRVIVAQAEQLERDNAMRYANRRTTDKPESDSSATNASPNS